MAHVEAPHFHNPLGHVAHEARVWAGRHWKSLSLTAAAGLTLIGGAWWAFQGSRPGNSSVNENTGSSNSKTIKDPGLEGGAPGPTLVPISTETPKPVPTSTSTPEPTSTPKPKVGYENTESGLAYRTEQGAVLNVPKIEGLKPQLDKTTNKMVYQAESGNAYGLEAGQYAGEFIPNVTVAENNKQKETGGVALVSSVVKSLIEQKLATIPEQKDKWVAAIPVDISKSKTKENVSLNFEPGKGLPDIKGAKVQFTGELPLMNIIPDSQQIRLAQSVFYGVSAYDLFRAVEPYTNIYPGKEERYISMAGDITDFSTNKTIKSQFGEQISTVKNFIILSMSTPRDSRSFTLDHILNVDTNQIPVFMASPSSLATQR